MTFQNNGIIIIVVGVILYLIYTQQNSSASQTVSQPQKCPPCKNQPAEQPNIQIIERNGDSYADPIKKQDIYTMYDPLTYPQLRLPRDVLDRYNDYYNKTGAYPPFNIATQPQLFDNPILNGMLIKVLDENDPFSNSNASSIPLFRVRSMKNTNRYFYYILDQQYQSKVELKIPLDNIKINGTFYKNADYYGVPEMFDGDIVEGVPIFPGTKYRVVLYKSYHFP